MSKRLSTEEFINKAKKTYHYINDDYSEVNYIDSITKIKIICPVHGSFYQLPNNYLRGRNCPECRKNNLSIKNRKTLEKFINDANNIHGNKYGYSKVVYINANTKVKIYCKTCKKYFKQKPVIHLNGGGCPHCAIIKVANKKKIKAKNSFIEKANKKHGNKYGYSKVVYIKAKTKVIIKCTKHGDFSQTPNNHLNGHGCPYCVNNIKLTTKQFIKKANKKHGNKYGYSKVKYIGVDKKVIITCPKHGDFKQSPRVHLRGSGCPKCTNNNIKLTTKQFIKKANKKHGNKYGYSKVVYIKNDKKVIITCPKHGNFKQTPSNHLRGCGCPDCSTYGIYNRKKAELYILYDSICKICKIGIAKETEKRKKKIESKLRYKLEIYFIVKNFGHHEREIHKELENYHVHHPLKTDGYTEWFKITPRKAKEIILKNFH